MRKIGRQLYEGWDRPVRWQAAGGALPSRAHFFGKGMTEDCLFYAALRRHISRRVGWARRDEEEQLTEETGELMQLC
jgi:hypothetical protein